MKYVSLCGEYINKNYGNKFYAKCQNLVILLKRAYDVALEQYDVIVMPTLPSKAPKLPEKSWSLSGIFFSFSFATVVCILESKTMMCYIHSLYPTCVTKRK